MKRGTKLLILLGVLILVAGTFLLIKNLNVKDNTDISESYQTVFKLDPAKVTGIGWKYSYEANFKKTENGWVNEEDSAFPVDAAPLEKMLTALTEVKSAKTIEKPTDLDQYGLKNPFCTIKVTVDGTTYNLALGDQNAQSGRRYFSNGDGNVYMLVDDIAGSFNFGPEGALMMETIPNLSKLTALKVESDNNSYEIVYEEDSDKTYSSHYKWFMGDKVLDTELTASMLETIYSLEWKECADYNATDLVPYGLDKPALVATVTYSEDKTFVLELGSETDKGVYARIAGSNMVYLVRSAVLNTLRNTVYNELMPDEVLAMDWNTVTAMDIILGGKTYTLTYMEVPDENGCATGEYAWKYNDKEVAGSTITGKLDSMPVTGYATGLAVEQAEELRIVFYRNASHHNEIELVFYPYNSGASIVTMDGKLTVLADRTYVTALITAINNMVAA